VTGAGANNDRAWLALDTGCDGAGLWTNNTPSFLILIFVCFFLCCLKAQHGHWPVGEKGEERRKKERKKRLSESARVLMCVTWPNTGAIFWGNHLTLIEIRVSLENSS
jgi:hypothetical protein